MSKRLTKSKDNVVISGALAGIAEYIGIDPTIVRVVYFILSIVSWGFPGFTLYIALMILMPSGYRKKERYEPYDSPYQRNSTNQGSRPRKEAEKLDSETDDWSDF